MLIGLALRRIVLLLLVATLAAGSAACAPPGRAALRFSPGSLADARVGQPYDQRIEISGNETPVLRFSVQNGVLPAGLRIEKIAGSDNAGRIVGTPLVAGTSSFEVTVTCAGTNVSGQTGTQAYTLAVR